MTREELDWSWNNQDPIEGVAFMLKDGVQVVAGPHAGEHGSTVHLLSLEPEPLYRVELGSGSQVTAPQSHLRSALTQVGSGVAELQHWYATQTDGDWEHTCGIRIETLDNPGWSLDVDLADTPLARRPFTEVADLEPRRDWLICRVSDGRFEARGGPFMLDRMLGVFAAWARSGPTPPSDQAWPVRGDRAEPA
jgi:hypothetical protein